MSNSDLPSYDKTTLKPNIKLAKQFRKNVMPFVVINGKGEPQLADINEDWGVASKSTKIFPLFHNVAVLDDYGVGVGLYFRALKALFVVFGICAFINLAAIYENKKYNPNQNDIKSGLLIHSTSENTATELRLLGTVYGADRNSFVLGKQGATTIVNILLIFGFILVAIYLEGKLVEKLDADVLTTQDFSLCYENPPGDIADPDVNINNNYVFILVLLVPLYLGSSSIF
jgi:hypothetical protein